MQQDYQSPPYYPTASFGADPPLTVPPSSPISNLWLSARLYTPQWLKEATTIAVGVFGGMALFKVFQRRIPAPKA